VGSKNDILNTYRSLINDTGKLNSANVVTNKIDNLDFVDYLLELLKAGRGVSGVK
jgi:hypothetical protein